MGVEEISMKEIASNPRKYLYPLWNRLASGSYFPPPVREVPISKGNGKERMLGIPTIIDRVAQGVIRADLEKIVEPLFHPSSFGYRPGKSAHDAIDQWLELTQPRILFERYADDIVIHTRSIEQSNFILDKLKARLKEYSLEIHPDKTKIVFCYRTARFFKEGKNVPVSFDFFGFTFKPRLCLKSNGEKFWGFRPAISKKSEKRILGELSKLAIHNWVSYDIHGLANALSSKIQGWLNYYGKFRMSEMQWLFMVLNIRIAKWARKKYKLKTYAKSYGWLKRIIKWYPNTFVHWKYGFTG